MHEIVINLHMHTPYSDGYGTHSEIAAAAMQAGLDAVIITDHNIFVGGFEKYYFFGDKKVMVIIGEEVHDQARLPQKSHLLVFGVDKEISHLAYNPQLLIDTVRQSRGLAFIAHPFDPESRAAGETDISWVDWEVKGVNGIELWNAMSEFKSLISSRWVALIYALFPDRIAHAPFKQVLERWDFSLNNGHKWVAIGGSDAHALPASLGPIRRVLFPYEWHFRGINTHCNLPEPLSGDINDDKAAIFKALSDGNCFIGYDLPHSTRGFRFTANGRAGNKEMGSTVSSQGGVTFQIRLPIAVECRLLCNGQVIRIWRNSTICTHITSDCGAYRVEAYIKFHGKNRGWIFSNPIYVIG